MKTAERELRRKGALQRPPWHKPERKNMKEHAEESAKDTHCVPQQLKTPAKPHVRYEGFESIEGGRRLMFSLKPVGHEWMEFAIVISDGAFRGARGISIQDAAPMGYEKIVELLAAEDALESNEACLSDADIAQYITRHLSSKKCA